jgi:hypothetical protein
MSRWLYIVAEDADMDAAIATATQAGIAEVVRGIPPRLRHELAGRTLPVVYEEVLPEPKPDRVAALEQKLEALDARLKSVEDGGLTNGGPPR